MASSRGKGKPRATRARATSSRATRSTRASKDAVPDVYQEMLAEEAKRSPEDDLPDRPLKRRRAATGVRIPSARSAAQSSPPAPSSPAPQQPDSAAKSKARAMRVQTAEASSDDDESEFDFEDVDLSRANTPGTDGTALDDDGIADVSISVDPSTRPKVTTPAKRKPITSAERALRLLTHKAHVLCLLGHCMYANTWCNDITVQSRLHPLLSKKTLGCLQGREDFTQFQRDRAFRDGLERASEVFRGHFKVNASSMKRAVWGLDGEDAQDHNDVDSTSRQDLIMAAREMEGSQDTGNQLFCALLRSAGVEARLVCSLQPLPLTASQAKIATPQTPSKSEKPVVRAMPPYGNPTASSSNPDDDAVTSSSTIGKVPSARRRLGQPSLPPEKTALKPAAPPVNKKPVRKLDYPVFWAEAFNTALQKWTPVDPVVTQTVGKPSKFEPPSSYALNQMSYVIAFEEDGVARDVTRRYTKAYNAKTRRKRVESTENGVKWFQKALHLFRRRGGALDRDQTEDAELNQKEAREGLPGNVQDFKDHPVYALERHLKRNEIIEPKREVGKVNAGTAAKPRMEPVYRRSDVLVCRSGDKWYRMGRAIQEGSTPIKHVAARNPRGRGSLSPDADGEDAAGVGMTALYAHHQTEMYVAPAVVKGKVPRNTFGNLDIYVPSMLPPGGTHIRHALAQQAARTLRVDYADAVTGFKFKGRHGTAIIQGAVVPTEYAEAVEAVIDGLLNGRLEEESLARSAAALKMWKRFVTGLRIKERIDTYGTEGEGRDAREEVDRQVEEQEEIAEAGGFFAEEPAMPTAGKFSLVEMARVGKGKGKQTSVKQGRKRSEESGSEEEAEFSGVRSGDGMEQESLPARRSNRVRRKVVQDDDEEEGGEEAAGDELPIAEAMDLQSGGGGFLPGAEVDDFGGGGFVPEGGDSEDDGGAGGFIAEDELTGGGFVPEEVAAELDEEGSGGFVPEDDAGGFLPDSVLEDANEPAGGGFLAADEDGPPEEMLDVSTNRGRDLIAPVTAPPHESDGLAGEVEGGQAVAELSMHGALPAAADEHHARPAPAEMDVDEPPATEDAAAHHVEGGKGKRGEAFEAEGEGESGDSDHGSMLSHDPEDEDAEPDWLESD